MDSAEPHQQRPEESLTFVLRKSTKNVFLAKIIILFSLTLLAGYFFARDSAQNYEKGRELTQEKYLEEFDEYRGDLLSSEETANVPVATFAMFVVVSFLIGSYELAALIIGFMIGKLIRR